VRTRHIAQSPTANVALQTASKSDLVGKYNQIADSIKAINAGVTMQVSSSSAYSGVIKDYHQVNGFILAQKPAFVRVIGQLPVVGTNIFDMVSDGKTFSLSVPSKHQFLTGSAKLEKPSAKPVENLRPQHLMEAIFWQAIPDSEPVLLEETADNSGSYYVLTLVSRGSGAADWKIARKLWFERVNLTLGRLQTYDDDGQLESDIHYNGWSPFGAVQYPKQITLERPADGYTITITVTKLTANAPVEASRFVLAQPAGTQLVRVGEDSGGSAQ
jgi:outer membrane lipoprotein-sorting protein